VADPADSAERVALLGHVPVFAGLTEYDLVAVAAVSVSRRYAAGEVVFREGDEGDTCYIMRSGLARAVRQHSDGRSITLSHFSAGDIFGELAMFGGEPRSATVDVIEDTEVIAVPGREMQRLIREHPEISVKLIAALAQRLRATNERLARQSFQSVQSRVAAVLGQIVAAARDGNPSDSDVVITLTQADLAKLAGSSRESASRFLAALERSGVITQGRGRVTVHDPQALEGYVY
jgi:CRP/FNR family transcriptional regulator, cyclic AMP receptor protein